MTSFEHALLGVDGVLAVGLHRTYGWQLTAIAGIAATLPDWDGLTILFSTQLFNESHRAWGHNVFSCLVFVVGMLAMVRWRARAQAIAGLTLLSVVGYAVVRCLMGY